MEPEWMKVATSPGLWVIGFVFAGSALIQRSILLRFAILDRVEIGHDAEQENCGEIHGRLQEKRP